MQVNRQGRSFQSGVGLSSDIKSPIIDELYRIGGNRTTRIVPAGSYTSVSQVVKDHRIPSKRYGCNIVQIMH